MSVLINICGLFDGDLIQLFMVGDILFFVIEMKQGYTRQDNIAQLFLELLCKPEFSFLSYAEFVIQLQPKRTRVPNSKASVFMVYLLTSMPFIFTRMIKAEGSLPLMRRC